MRREAPSEIRWGVPLLLRARAIPRSSAPGSARRHTPARRTGRSRRRSRLRGGGRWRRAIRLRV